MKSFYFLLPSLFVSLGAFAQILPDFTINKTGNSSKTPPTNSISNMDDYAPHVLLGTSKGLYFYGLSGFQTIKTGFSDLDTKGVYSVSGSGNLVFFATGEIRQKADADVTTGVAYAVSTDSMKTWTRIELPLDKRTDDTLYFGNDTIPTLPIVVPEQFVTYDSELNGDTIWVATWSGGIRKSTDAGKTWSRVLLPPDNRNYISPDSSYSFFYSPVEEKSGLNRGGGDLNFLGFSVHKTASGVLWAGTAGGINRRYQPDGWIKYTHSPVTSTLPGNWIVGIGSHTFKTKERVWAICWRALGSSEKYALAFTEDNGETWSRTLTGEKIYDIAFNGDSVLAAGQSGVFYSVDGLKWGFKSNFSDPESKNIIPYTQFYSASFSKGTNSWLVGSGQGLIESKSSDFFSGNGWSILRKDVQESESGSFAYPNPFSPDDDRYCRFSFPSSSSATVSILSNDHLLVRKLEPVFSGNSTEILWDGRDSFGNRLSNGLYLYHIQTSGNEFWGKLLILE
ncbi:MAG: hypothetical protein LCH54_12095 [Bacteroidetes bacterium]|nr:hypothetical protein [Bacteroidota bacterium]